MRSATVVIPCFDEALRLRVEDVLSIPEELALDVVLVDDGSTDGTLALLRQLEQASPAIRVVALPSNLGKAEAVRLGLLEALRGGAEIVGYLDADLSTPPREFARLVAALAEDEHLGAALGARVALLGRDVQRRAHRHYLGRVFATLASLALALPVYDTQCGAKAFRAGPALRAALADPFSATWAFDVELLGRLVYPRGDVPPMPFDALVEVPLGRWHDVSGSKLRPSGMGQAAIELARTARSIRLRESFRRARR